MESKSIYKDIEQRTQGDIYIGVVGPVRTGKSTFIKRFMDTIVIPNMESDAIRDRTVDEMPQSAAGRTIMTTEPKFIPEEAAQVMLPSNSNFKVRLIDCVGYIVPSSLGYIEGEMPRMVKTPWFDDEIPFNMAAEIGTQKVISEHSTIGLVVTTDGSISDIPRYEYEEAEERVIGELKDLNKPFVVLLNCMYPRSTSAQELSEDLSGKYNVPVVPVNCLDLTEDEIKEILTEVLFEFPIREIKVDLPTWLLSLGSENDLKRSIFAAVTERAKKLSNMRGINEFSNAISNLENINEAHINNIDLGIGSANIGVTMDNKLFYNTLSNMTGLPLDSEQSLMNCLTELAVMKGKYDRLKGALDEVEATGYGIVMPAIEELTLEEPEIMKQGGKYGVRLKASAPSIHMMKANINTEVAPIVGSESQSEELVMYLLQEFEENPARIWESNIFGKSLNELVNEGLRNKLFHMPGEARLKLQETLERVINEGCSGLICIII
ncbi:MAG: stage IV sporulation protein A [Oscillospiraceae bacterium]|jgi:stage IV sporulation protein A|nr:stage IV sporulation protein A [Oscillospiraceae bacterium]